MMGWSRPLSGASRSVGRTVGVALFVRCLRGEVTAHDHSGQQPEAVVHGLALLRPCVWCAFGQVCLLSGVCARPDGVWSSWCCILCVTELAFCTDRD